MNAHDKGHEAGFAAYLSYARITKAQFEQIGKEVAAHMYKTAQKQAEFLQGWMENWRDEPPPPLPPGEEILTF